METLKEIMRLRAAEAEQRREGAMQFAADVEKLVDDIAAGVPWNALDERWQTWLLGLSPAAFDHFKRRCRDRAGASRSGKPYSPARKAS